MNRTTQDLAAKAIESEANVALYQPGYYPVPGSTLKYLNGTCMTVEDGYGDSETRLLREGELLLLPIELTPEGLAEVPAETRVLLATVHGCSVTSQRAGIFAGMVNNGKTLCMRTGETSPAEPVEVAAFNSAYVILAG